LVEDAGYCWTLSRYIHLNPCNGSKPLASDPEAWPHSSFSGYACKSKRAGWIAYDQLHATWQASVGGKDPFRAYRTYVKEGLASAHDPFKQELREWVFGSEDFLRRMIALAEGTDRQRHESTSRRLHSVTVEEIIEATASRHGVEASQYAEFHSSAAGRDMAAWLCRRWTGASLSQLGPTFGLSGTDSVSNLVRRAERRHRQSPDWCKTAGEIEASLGLNTEHKA
jgi:hypothetical protein